MTHAVKKQFVSGRARRTPVSVQQPFLVMLSPYRRVLVGTLGEAVEICQAYIEHAFHTFADAGTTESRPFCDEYARRSFGAQEKGVSLFISANGRERFVGWITYDGLVLDARGNQMDLDQITAVETEASTAASGIQPEYKAVHHDFRYPEFKDADCILEFDRVADEILWEENMHDQAVSSTAARQNPPRRRFAWM
jgi:hypothetical protein